MSSNAQTILEDLLAHNRNEVAPNLSPHKFFELFTAEQILKNYGLSYEELESGLVDEHGNEGGIDAFYTFVNGTLVTEEANFDNLKENITILLVIIQSKTTQGFSEEAILRLESTTKELLDLRNNPLDYTRAYNTKLLRQVSIFHKTYRALARKLPRFQISYYYATEGDHIHPNVERKVPTLERSVKHLYTECGFSFYFLGAPALLALSRRSKSESLQIRVVEYMATSTMGTICLVQLRDYYEFITDSISKELRRWLFDENVRDYEGRNIDVNKGIRDTLEHPEIPEDFWWLNNRLYRK